MRSEPSSSLSAFAAARVSGETEPWSTNFDLYAVSVDGGATPRNLTEANAAWDTHPLFSPDGKTLVYLAMERPGYEADRFRVIARPWPEGPTRVVSDQYDNSIRDMTFRPDGSALIATAQDHGQTLLLEVKLDGAVSPLVGDGTVSAPGAEQAQLLAEVLDAVGSGRLHPTTPATRPLDEAGSVLRDLLERRLLAKTVLVPQR